MGTSQTQVHAGLLDGRGWQGSIKTSPYEEIAEPEQMVDSIDCYNILIAWRQVATSKSKLKAKTPKGYVDGRTARAHVATARVLAQAKITP